MIVLSVISDEICKDMDFIRYNLQNRESQTMQLCIFQRELFPFWLHFFQTQAVTYLLSQHFFSKFGFVCDMGHTLM